MFLQKTREFNPLYFHGSCRESLLGQKSRKKRPFPPPPALSPFEASKVPEQDQAPNHSHCPKSLLALIKTEWVHSPRWMGIHCWQIQRKGCEESWAILVWKSHVAAQVSRSDGTGRTPGGTGIGSEDSDDKAKFEAFSSYRLEVRKHIWAVLRGRNFSWIYTILNSGWMSSRGKRVVGGVFRRGWM